jgi:hypothetical protein
MALDIQQKTKILDFAVKFSAVAKKQGWVSHYDTDTDSMAIRSPELSSGAQKKYLNDEFAFYLNHKNEVQGVFIEYFMSNFVVHHEDMKGVKKEITKEIKERMEDKESKESAVIQLELKETTKMIPELQNLLIDSLVPVA